MIITVLFHVHQTKAATETFNTGSFIIDMGVTPQTVSNGLKPYGLIYDLIKNHDVLVKWVINPGKIKDGIDFTYNGQNFRGGTFIVPVEFRTAAVNAVIASWQAKGVVGVTTAYAISLNVTMTLRAAPYWAMDAQNGYIAIRFLQRAEIPSTAYYYRTPATLNNCDDLYVMPHADAKWSTHSNLYFWNKNSKGGIWGGCTAVSAMEGPACVNPSNPSQNLKFLSTGGLVQWTAHNNGTPPYNYLNVADPVFQMMGSEDAAHQNGWEQIYLPLKTGSSWHPNVKIGCHDPTHTDIPGKSNGPAALTLYGRAFNDSTRGYVMYQGGHDIGGTSAANVSAQREFFNWSFLVATDKAPGVTYSNIQSSMNSGQLYNNLTATPVSPVGMVTFTYSWYSTIGGTFSSPNTSVTNYTPPAVGVLTPAVIYCKITDGCGRSIIEPVNVTIVPVPMAPVPVNDTILYTGLCAATSKTINVLTNDSDINGNMVNSISFIGGGNYGSFINNGNGSVTYIPGWLFYGTDTMRYEVCDDTPLCAQGTIVVTTTNNGPCPLNQYQATDTAQADSVELMMSVTDAQEALGDYDATNGSNTLTANFNADNDSLILRLNATINSGDTIRIRASSNNGNCVDWTAAGSLTAGGFVPGVNSMDFTAPGAAHNYQYYNFIVTAATRYVKITIRPTACDHDINIDAMRANYRYCTNAVPTANGDTITTGKNTATTNNVRTNDSDPQGQTLSTIIVDPANGTAGVDPNGNIIYTPDSGYVGTDQLIYRACNTSCLCDTAIVTYIITDNPCSSNQIGTFINGHAVAVTSQSNTTNPNNSLGVPDATNGSNANTVVIDNTIGANIVLDMNDTIPATDTLIIRIAPDNASANSITVEGNLTNAWGSPTTTTVFNLPAGAGRTFADYEFIVTAQTRYIRIRQTSTTADVDVDAVSFDFWKCTNKPNRPPVANNDTADTYANRAVNRNVITNDADPDGNSLSISIINPMASNGNAVVAGNTITYTPDFGFTGMDTVTYELCDNGTPSLCDTAVFIVTVVPGPPVAMTDTDFVTSGSFVTTNVQANDTLSVNSYTYTTALKPTILSASNGTTILVGNSIQYTPDAGFTGTDSLAYEICDNGAPVACDTAILYVTVMNQAPGTDTDSATTSACNAVIINVVANDNDPENGILTINNVSVPSNGTAVISNNQIVYTPTSSPVFTGIDSFTYEVCDNGITTQCSNGNVIVTVNSNNPPSNPPAAINDSDFTFINQDLAFDVLANDSDPDADSMRVDSTAVGLLLPAIGTITYLPNNHIMYTPDPGVMGVDSFEYQVCDIHQSGAGCINIVSSCSIAKAYVSINNRPPAANDDQFSTINTFALSNSVAANDDIEPDGQTMTYSIITNPAVGSLVLNPDGTFTYTPDGFYVGDVDFTYLVCDDVAPPMCDTALVTISILTSNVPPNAIADTITTYGITPYNGTVATNDGDPNNNLNPNGYTMMTGPINGDIIFNNDGSYTYTAYNGFIGMEYVYYEVCDTGNPVMCSYATLNIIVPDSAPVILNDTFSLNEDITLIIPDSTGITSNDFDPNGTTLTVDTVPIMQPTHGVITLSPGGGFTFVPDTNFNGTDFFIVNVCDSSALCIADTVNLIINPVNDVVIVFNDGAVTPEDVPLSGTIISGSEYDIDTTALVVDTVPVLAPSNGTFSIAPNGNFTYTPSADFNGDEVIVVSVCDSGSPLPATCVNDTLFITVNAGNDPPVTANDTITLPEDSSTAGNIITPSDYDPDTTAVFANTTPVVDASNGTFSIDSTGAFTYSPDPDYNGTDMVVISICDNGTPMPSACTNDTLFIYVTAVNDAPVVSGDNNTVSEDNPATGNIITAGDIDPDTTTLIADTIPVLAPSNGTLLIDSTGAYTYTPAPGYNGTDTMVISVCDNGTPLPAICINDTLIITVNAINDPPVISNDTITLPEDSIFSGTIITAADFDADSTALFAVTIPVQDAVNGTFTVDSTGSFTYTPDPDFNGTETVIVSICDNGNPLPSACVNDTLFITVTPVNDAPVTSNDNNSTNEDNPVSGNIITAGDFDPDTTALRTDTVPVLDPSNGTLTVDTMGAYTYTPFADFNGTDTMVISVCDTGTPLPSLCTNDTLIITVNPLNDPPVIANDTAEVDEDSFVIGSVIGGLDTDIDGMPLSADTVPVVAPANGTISISTNGSYQYTPSPDFNGSDIAVVSVCDSGSPLPSLCVNDTIYFTIHPVNDTAIVSNDTISTSEDAPVIGNIITVNDFDIDTTALSVDIVPLAGPFHGMISIDTLGAYTFTPDADYNGPDTVVLNVCDSGRPLPAICVNDTLFITVSPVNDTPVVVNDSMVVCSGSNGQIDPLINDSDTDQDVLLISSITQPSNGSAITNGVSIDYTPSPGFIGPDSLDYTICDSGTPQLCSTGRIYITVNGISSMGITATDALCFGDSSGAVSTSPVGNGPFTYLWNTNATTQNISNVPAGTYSVAITDSNGCVRADSANVQQPAAAISLSALADDADCAGDSSGSVSLTASGGTAPYGYLWNTTDTSQNLVSVPSGIYSVIVTDANGCIDSTLAYVSEPPAISSYASITPANCLENTNGFVDVTVSGGTPGYSFAWSSGQATEDLSEITGNYTITITDTNGCVHTANYFISDTSALMIISSLSNNFCEPDSTTLFTSATNGALQWYYNSNPISGATDSLFITGQPGSYHLTLSSACGNFTSNQLDLVVNPRPVLAVSGNATICEGESSQLSISGADSYSWSPVTGLDNATSSNPLATPSATTTYTVTGTLLNCSDDAITTITVNPLPAVNIISGTHDCNSGTQLQASGGDTYSWIPSTGLDSTNIANPVAKPEVTTSYTVTVVNSYSCTSTAYVIVVVDCDTLRIPDGFSPDNDGVNDVLVIEGLDDFPGTSLSIFNRWGNEVYANDDYDNSWDAVAQKNGIILGQGKVPSGTYFYMLKLGGRTTVQTGYLIIKY